MTYTQKLTQAFQAHHRYLVFWLQKRAACCQPTAEDIAGEAWLKIIQKQLPPDFALLRKIAVDIMRSRATRERLIPVDEVPDVAMSPQREEPGEPPALPINRLPPEHRAVVTTLLEAVRNGATHQVKHLALECGVSRYAVYRIRNMWKAKRTLEPVK